MGNSSSHPQQVQTKKFSSEQIQANIRDLFNINEKTRNNFTDTIGWYDSENNQTGGNKFLSPKKERLKCIDDLSFVYP
jgi:hypothetical protein